MSFQQLRCRPILEAVVTRFETPTAPINPPIAIAAHARKKVALVRAILNNSATSKTVP